MRPVRTVAAVLFAAAIAVTGCAANSTADHPSQPPTPPMVVDQAPTPPIDLPEPTPRTPAPKPPVNRAPALADGRYDAYVRRVDIAGNGGPSHLVVDLVQVFHDQAAVDAAIADGQSRDTAQYLSTYVRNENPRLRTLTVGGNAQVNLLGGDCEAPVSHKLGELARHARSSQHHHHHYYYALTVTGGAVRQIQELRTANAC
jgi:hypothetical protein